jgi:CYTH domain-containing protein
MPIEIERKFLVVGNGWRQGASPERLTQGYISVSHRANIRVRRVGDRAFLTIKSGHAGLARMEYEYEIPARDGDELLGTLCAGSVIDKMRHTVTAFGHTWVIDEFIGSLSGLVIAEVELTHADEPVRLPTWIGDEVTGDPRYLNSRLSSGRHPGGRREGTET